MNDTDKNKIIELKKADEKVPEKLVYKLYRLTEDEIKIIENNTK